VSGKSGYHCVITCMTPVSGTHDHGFHGAHPTSSCTQLRKLEQVPPTHHIQADPACAWHIASRDIRVTWHKFSVDIRGNCRHSCRQCLRKRWQTGCSVVMHVDHSCPHLLKGRQHRQTGDQGQQQLASGRPRAVQTRCVSQQCITRAWRRRPTKQATWWLCNFECLV
jgi:hypothetical protein